MWWPDRDTSGFRSVLVLWPGLGGPEPAFPLLFHDNSASQTSFISISTLNTILFPTKASCAKILANTAF